MKTVVKSGQGSSEWHPLETILVTGAAGLIGSAVVRVLLCNGMKVVALDDFSIGEYRGSCEQLTWEELDITTPSLHERLNAHNIDAVVHCAAHPGGKSLKEPVKNVEVNALGSMRLFEWCAANEKSVIYTSSSVVYGEQPPGPIPESAEPKPGTIYGACKIACENFLRILGEGKGLNWIVLRLFATYGPGHRPSDFQGIVNIMLTQLLRGKQVIVKGSLERIRDLVYVEDVADAICASLRTPAAFGRIMNIGTGVPVTILELIETLCKILGKGMESLEIREEPGTVGDPFSNLADFTMASNVLGFRPRYDLERGLEAYIAGLPY